MREPHRLDPVVLPMKQIFALAGLLALTGCLSHPAPSGAAYRAVGTEPFWGLLIDPANITFTAPHAAPVIQRTPSVINGFAGPIYQTPRINVNIVRNQRCSDGMSDRVYPDKVQVTADGRRFEGCGGEAVMPATLAGTSWRVASINGRVTPPGGQFFMNFEAARIGAKFGCNGLGTNYSQAADTITTGPVMATRMACPDMSFETQGSAILERPMKMVWSGGDRLTLSNERGSIELVRSY